jgi:hypothetical protein
VRIFWQSYLNLLLGWVEREVLNDSAMEADSRGKEEILRRRRVRRSAMLVSGVELGGAVGEL